MAKTDRGINARVLKDLVAEAAADGKPDAMNAECADREFVEALSCSIPFKAGQYSDSGANKRTRAR